MRRVTRNGVIAVAAASGAMAMTMPAFADSAANGSAAGSPGLVSGNGVQLPVHVPVNLCGNTVNAGGLLNPAVGNSCVNGGSTAARTTSGGGATATGGGATATGDTAHSPGAVSGNNVELPVDLPLNATGNSVNVVGIGNPAFGNQSVNTSDGGPAPAAEPPVRHTPPAASRPAPASPDTVPQAGAPQAPTAQAGVPSLAHTGADATAPVLLGSTALILGGAILYRRSRPGTER
ncbi:chaplin [Streptomyces sp. NPDC051315]|uniref:chaplin n=1 Tax=Streptomyces sp. NPDC051315 TaxID=3365650 RepID=UPI0037B9595D